ncbi:unnamed protein product [Phaeothamnion confervicola]
MPVGTFVLQLPASRNVESCKASLARGCILCCAVISFPLACWITVSALLQYTVRPRGRAASAGPQVIDLDAQDDEIDDIQQEIQALQGCNCPQLVRYHGSFMVGATLWIVMEHLEGGSLQELMNESGTTFDEATIAWVMSDILHSLVYLHGQRRIHRDIKAGNILAAGDGSVRLTDFGVSAQLTTSWDKRKTFVGSPYWMAPEAREIGSHYEIICVISETDYDATADVWSLGITAIELALGRPPHSDKHPLKAVLLVPKGPPPTLPPDDPRFSKRFAAFLEACLVKDPKQRPNAVDLVRHPFIKGAARTPQLREMVESRKATAIMADIFKRDRKSGGGAGGADGDGGGVTCGGGGGTGIGKGSSPGRMARESGSGAAPLVAAAAIADARPRSMQSQWQHRMLARAPLAAQPAPLSIVSF